jgi:hypothetical protein
LIFVISFARVRVLGKKGIIAWVGEAVVKLNRLPKRGSTPNIEWIMSFKL